jgi:excisionase family DNA binding protein
MGQLFYTVKEAAEILGISEFTVRVWLRDGKIIGKRVGRLWRINKESVNAILPTKEQPE